MAGPFAAFTELEAERRRASATAHTGMGFSRTRRGTSAGPSRTFFDNVAQCTGKSNGGDPDRTGEAPRAARQRARTACPRRRGRDEEKARSEAAPALRGVMTGIGWRATPFATRAG